VRTFTDGAGRTWSVAVNVDALQRVRDVLKCDPLDVEQFVPRIIDDPIFLCDVVYCICKPQAETANVSDVEFRRAMGGDSLLQAQTAFLEELADFFPSLAKRKAVRVVLQKYAELQEKVASLVELKLQTADLPADFEKALAGAGESFTNLPESSVSTPVP